MPLGKVAEVFDEAQFGERNQPGRRDLAPRDQTSESAMSTRQGRHRTVSAATLSPVSLLLLAVLAMAGSWAFVLKVDAVMGG
jgi:hypothetical protein